MCFNTEEGRFIVKSLREQFEEDYAAVPYTDRPGGKVKIRYVYDAPWYRWNLPESVLKKKKWQMAGASVACLGTVSYTHLTLPTNSRV